MKMEKPKSDFRVQSRTRHLYELAKVYTGWILRKLKNRWSDE
jgi:hypothetical protein